MPETPPSKTPPLAYLIRQRVDTLIEQTDDDPVELAVTGAAPLIARAARQIANADDPTATIDQIFAWPLPTAHLGVLVAELALLAPDRVPLVRAAAARTLAAAGYGLLRREAGQLEIGDVLLDLGPDVSGHVVGREALMDGRLLFHLHLTDRRSNGPLSIMTCALAPDDLRVIADPEAL